MTRIAAGLAGHLRIILVALPTMAAAADPPAAPEPTEVAVQRVGRLCFVRAVHATGYIVPRDSAVVMFNAPDFRISDVLAKPGDMVKRGDIVAKASSTAPRPANAPAVADVAIRTLGAGLVLDRTAFVGLATSAQAAPLFTLALDGEMEAMLDVPATHVFQLQAGQVAHVSLRDGTVLDGHVRLAPLIIDKANQTGQARVAFDAGARPTPGRFVRATIEAEKSCGLGVPQAAVLKSSEGPKLQLVQDNLVITLPVKLGLSSDTDVEVTAGLRPGDLIIADAGAALHDGDRVKPVQGTP